MKKCIWIIALLIPANELSAQNVGIGTINPGNKLHVIGNLLLNQPTESTIAAPTPAQTKNLVNSSTITFPATDSTGWIYDPGGPAGNYTANVTSYAQVNGVSGCAGIEINFLDMDLNTGDSLIIMEYAASTNSPLFAAGNSFTLTGKITINSAGFYLIFKTNGDANLGRGFSLLFRRLYTNAATLPSLVNYAGSALYYDVKKSAFRAGILNNSVVGDYSFGAGYTTSAIGNYSVAFGNRTIASADYSTTFGHQTQATGLYSTASGYNSEASGYASTALGSATTASGSQSFAVGGGNTASGLYSVAMGNASIANAQNAIAMGSSNIAGANYALAMGNQAVAGGIASVALGNYTSAPGNYATAIGNQTYASGGYSTAMGNNTRAQGEISTSMGYNTTAAGLASTAIGFGSYCTGTAATAIGYNAVANANNSMALGSYASTNGQDGSFVIGDNSTTSYLNSAVPNGFRSRFAAGYGFYTSANLSTGVWLAAGGNSWLTISDSRLKENFLPVDGEHILRSIAAMSQYTWNYKTQDPKTFRHYGPMAQDFYKAFGKDDLGTIGCDSMINQHDFIGVNFIAIQALIVRSDKLEAENIMLKNKLSMIEQKFVEMEKLIREKK